MFVSIQPKPGEVRQGIIMQPPLLDLKRRFDQVRERRAVSNRYDDMRSVSNENMAEPRVRRITAAVQSFLFRILLHGSHQVQAIVAKDTHDREFVAL
jgi:hypothetical protein